MVRVLLTVNLEPKTDQFIVCKMHTIYGQNQICGWKHWRGIYCSVPFSKVPVWRYLRWWVHKVEL